MFKRRAPRSWLNAGIRSLWPQGGWGRALLYLMHRLRRLPDSPHRVARGIFAGIFVSFMPFYGIHMATAAVFALAIRGNVLAAIIGTLVGNPLTFPAIAWLAIETGYLMRGGDYNAPMSAVLDAFSAAASQLWTNTKAIFNGAPSHWGDLHRFYHDVFLPYMLGGLPTGIVFGLIGYYLTLPVVAGYQTMRSRKTRERVEARLASRAAALERAQAREADAASDTGEDR